MNSTEFLLCFLVNFIQVYLDVSFLWKSPFGPFSENSLPKLKEIVDDHNFPNDLRSFKGLLFTHFQSHIVQVTTRVLEGVVQLHHLTMDMFRKKSCRTVDWLMGFTGIRWYFRGFSIAMFDYRREGLKPPFSKGFLTSFRLQPSNIWRGNWYKWWLVAKYSIGGDTTNGNPICRSV